MRPSFLLALLLASHARGQGNPLDYDTGARKIAIIGAGAGGSSAAFWISKAKQRSGLNIEVDVYDKASYIGGRSTTVHPHDDASLPAVELGASIFVPANRNMMRATQEFNLGFLDLSDGPQDLAIWDGEKFVLSLSGDSSDVVTLVKKYGVPSLTQTQLIIQTAVNKILTLYDQKVQTWTSISNLAELLGWTRLTRQSASAFYAGRKISPKYINEFIASILRVNYAQNPDRIHALEGIVGMATSGATGVDGGNFQVFEQFLKRSGANVHLDTTVRSILPAAGFRSSKWSVVTSKGLAVYDDVIIAAPFHQTGILTSPTIASKIPSQPYVHLHVTLLTTTSPRPNPLYFNQPPSANITHQMLTTAGAHGTPEFMSMTYHGVVRPGEWVVKIFSLSPISDDLVGKLFKNTVTWVYRKEWESYPLLPPTQTFPPIKLDDGLFYVNAFEPFISTMETETLAARNVVDLLLKEEFHTGICPSSSATAGPNFVYGWDC